MTSPSCGGILRSLIILLLETLHWELNTRRRSVPAGMGNNRPPEYRASTQLRGLPPLLKENMKVHAYSTSSKRRNRNPTGLSAPRNWIHCSGYSYRSNSRARSCQTVLRIASTQNCSSLEEACSARHSTFLTCTFLEGRSCSHHEAGTRTACGFVRCVCVYGGIEKY